MATFSAINFAPPARPSTDFNCAPSGSKANKSSENTGAPEEIRTPDPQIRSLVLYPAELPVRSVEGRGT